MKTKFLPVMKDMEGNWLYFKESDVWRACRIADCDEEMIEECILGMKDEANDCMSCFYILMSELNLLPAYEDEIRRGTNHASKTKAKEIIERVKGGNK